MKNKILLSCAVTLFCCGIISAQPKAASKPKAIVKTTEPMRSPVWSPDGKQIAVTSMGNKGIWITNLNGNSIKQITSDSGAGYKMKWSADNSTILARPTIRENNRMFYEVKTYNVNTKQANTIVSKTRELKGLPHWGASDSDVIVGIDKKESVLKSGLITSKANSLKKGLSLLKAMEADPANVASQVMALNQFSKSIIFNPALSPDGEKISFQVGGKGLFVCNADGTNIKSLGTGGNATWTPDSKYLVISVTEDNGIVITKADLYSVDINNGNRQLIATDNLIALNPSISPDGTKIVFEGYKDGYIYLMNLKY